MTSSRMFVSVLENAALFVEDALTKLMIVKLLEKSDLKSACSGTGKLLRQKVF